MILLNLLTADDFLMVLIGIVVYLSVLFIVMPAHEFAHAFAAKSQGDYTAYHMKRYTLAPFAHIDKKGFLCLLIFGFGWAKPVPVDPRNYKHGKKSEVFVSLAGIIVNLLQGLLFCGLYVAFLLFLPVNPSSYLWYAYYTFFNYGILISFSLAVFNMLPVYPLDGYRFLSAVTKPGNSFIEFMRRNSFFIFIVLYFFMSAIFNFTLYPLANGCIWLWEQFFRLFI